MTSLDASWASSIFHALEAKVEKRYSRGLTVMGSYTFSKLIDYDIGAFACETLGGGNLQDVSNLRASRSASGLDQTHRLILNSVYGLPFAKGLHGAPGKIVGGWEVGAILSLFSGGPIGITSAANNTFSQGGNQRPNWNGVSPRCPARRPTAESTRPNFRIRRRSPSVMWAARSTVFEVTARRSLIYRCNKNIARRFSTSPTRRSLAPPNSVFGNAQFGTVSAQSNLPRIAQFALTLIM